MRDWFMRQFESSAVIQGTMALSCTFAIIYLSVAGRDVPEVLAAIVMAVIGFYFGSKNRVAA